MQSEVRPCPARLLLPLPSHELKTRSQDLGFRRQVGVVPMKHRRRSMTEQLGNVRIRYAVFQSVGGEGVTVAANHWSAFQT